MTAAPGVLANDIDPEGQPLTALLETGPTHGSVTLNADGSFIYTPTADFNGTDTFSYVANDAASDSESATVTISVAAVNDDPVAGDDSITTSEVQPVIIDVLANDSDVEGDTLSAELVSGPSHGSVALNADDSFTYTPNTGFSGSDSFEYRAVDAAGSFSPTAIVSLTVTPVDQGPNLSHAVVENVTSSWQTVAFGTSYDSAIVVGTPQYDTNSGPGVGQVMSANDDDWSVFWASSSSRTSPPNSNLLNIGKHVAEDPDATRTTEIIGYFVIESTQDGTIEGLPFVAGVGSDIVRGVDNGSSTYNYTAMPNAKTAVLSQAGMDGNDGGWAVLDGSDPLDPSGGTIDLVIDEDQLGDSERKHTTEQVAYLVIDPPSTESPERIAAIPLAGPLAAQQLGVESESNHRDERNETAPLLHGPAKLVAHVLSSESGEQQTKIELIDAALSDRDDDWSESSADDLLMGSITPKSLRGTL